MKHPFFRSIGPRLFALLLALSFAVPAGRCEETGVNANWYEVYVASFKDSDGDGIGDLKGLESRLDYIASLNFDGLWLMPIMPSPSYHKYDVTDYLAVDPAYGTVEDLCDLVAACHKRGIRLILDLPINHTSTAHPWFQQAANALREGREDDPAVGYYCFSRQQGGKMVPLPGTDWLYEEQFSGGNMPDLNLDNPAVVEEIRRIFAFWLGECGVDGFRLDAVTSYFAGNTPRNVEFLRSLKAMAEEIRPGSYLVGEAWTNLSEIARYYESGVDSFFLFPAAQAEGFIAQSLRNRIKSPAASYINALEQVERAIPGGVLAPFLSNHDTARAVASLQGRANLPKLKFAHGILAMLGGNTFTYYGEEIGMAGSGEDPNKRTAMYWNDGDMTSQPPGVTSAEYPYPCVDEQLADPDSLLHYIEEINALKQRFPAISRGTHDAAQTPDGFLCLMTRTWQGETVYIAMNFSSKETLTLSLSDDATTLAGEVLAVGGSCVLDETAHTLQMPPYAIAILE